MSAETCNHCGNDGKVRCDDAECPVCMIDDYCDDATACIHCATAEEKRSYEAHRREEKCAMGFAPWLKMSRLMRGGWPFRAPCPPRVAE